MDADTGAWLAATLVTVIVAVLHGIRLAAAPDILADEALYLTVARNIALGLGPLSDLGGYFWWHPPLYMLLEAGYLRLTGMVQADVLAALYTSREINVICSGLTAGLLLLFGRKLHSLGAGTLAAVLFALDPYVERINRRSMLETLSLLLALLGLYLFLTRAPRLSAARQIAAGSALGLALLTKEVMAFELAVIVGYAAWARREHLAAALRVSALAVGWYLLFPIWALLSGDWAGFASFRLYNLNKFLNLAAPRVALDPQGPSEITPTVAQAGSGLFYGNLLLLLQQYVVSYVAIVAAGLVTLWLLWRWRRTAGAPYLATWSVASYAFIAFGVTIGKISDQFFYYLIVPALLVVAYAVASWIFGVEGDRPLSPARRRTALQIAAPILLVAAVYNAGQWYQRYAVGEDDGYAQIYRYVRTNLPPGTQIVPSSDIANYLFGDRYNVQFHRSAENAIAHDARYFLFSSKEGLQGYNHITPSFYAWITQSTRPLVEVQEPTFWTLGLYYRPLEPSASAAPVGQAASPASTPLPSATAAAAVAPSATVAPTLVPTAAASPTATADLSHPAVVLGQPVLLGPSNESMVVLATNKSTTPKAVTARVTVKPTTGASIVAEGTYPTLPPGATRLITLRPDRAVPRTYDTINTQLVSAVDAPPAANDPSARIGLGEVRDESTASGYSAQVEARNRDSVAHGFTVRAAFAAQGKLVGLVVPATIRLAPGQSRPLSLTSPGQGVKPDAVYVWVDEIVD